MITTIIFDLDGVLDDSYEMHYEYSRKKFTNLTREEHRKLFEGNIHAERAKLAHRDTGFDFAGHVNSSRFGKEMPVMTKNVVETLAQRYRLGIISSGMESGIHAYLKHNDVSQCFAFVYGVETSKSKEEKLKILLTQFHLEKTECIFVTDTLGDIKEANILGIKAIGYTGGYHERERLTKGNPYAIIDNLNQIEEILKSLNT